MTLLPCDLILGEVLVRQCIPPAACCQDHRRFPQLYFSMSQTPSNQPTTSVASSRFQEIFDAALQSYRKQTKKDLSAHPLASQLRSCDSTSAIIAVLEDQVREFDKSRSGDEKLTKWLNPTVNVLYAFSAAVSGGVSLVSLGMCVK